MDTPTSIDSATYTKEIAARFHSPVFFAE